MKELFTNILENAFAALSGRQGTIEIIGFLKNPGTVTVIIKDNGPGIDEGHLQKVFEPFFSTRARGTGLGLAVALQIVRLHSGAISIKSAPQQGTAVEINLPLKRSADE
jgi:signal transduction histidine kinase